MKVRRFLYGLMLFVLLIVSAAISKNASSASYSLTILHTSDLYGRIHPRRNANLGGVMWLSGQIAEQRQQASGPVLLLDSGDIYQTDFDASYSKGAAMIAFFNAAGYDAWVPGNHDFDWGKDNIARLAQQARFDTLAANIVNDSDGQTWAAIKPYTLKEFDGFTVAILGLAAPETPQMTKTSGLVGLEFTDPIAIAQQYVPELRRQADIVIVLSHLHHYTEQTLALQVPGIDIIVGGADHDPIYSPEYIGNTLLVNAGQYATHLGRLKLWVDPDNDVVTLDDETNILIEVVPNQGTPDSEVEAALKPYLDEAKPIGDEVIGQSDEDMSQAEGEALGYFVTDVMLAHESSCGKASIALYNWAGLRDSLHAGAVTYRDVFNVVPFHDQLVYLEMSGEQILSAIEEQSEQEGRALLAGLPSSSENETENWHATTANEVQLDANRQYRLVTVQYLSEQYLSYGTPCEETLDQILADYFRSQATSSDGSFSGWQAFWGNLPAWESAQTIDGFGIASPHLRVGTEGLSEALDAQQRMGIRWTREDIAWELVEPQEGVWNWQGELGAISYDYDYLLDELEQRNIEMVALLDYGPRYLKGDANNNYHVDSDELVTRWREYVRRVVNQFGDRIDYWEIGSQMNSRFFWGKVVIERDDAQNPDAPANPEPELYARMLKVAYEQIKAHNQNDVVILGGLAGFHSDLAECETNYFNYIGQLNKAGAWDAFDVMAIHPYHNGPGDRGEPPEKIIERGLAYDPASGECLESVMQHNLISEVRAVRELTEMYGRKPIWITEIGWGQDWSASLANRYRQGSVTEAQLQADYLVRTYVPLLAEPDVEKVFWYTQVDDPNVTGWELLAEGQHALAHISTLLTGSTPLGQIQGQNDRGRANDDDVYEYRFAKDNQLIIVIWKARGGDVAREVTIEHIDVGTLHLYDIDAINLSPEAGNERTVKDGQITVELTERPIFLVAEIPSWWEWSWPTIELDSFEWQKSFSEWSERQQEEWTRWFDEWSKRQQEEWARWFEEQQRKMEREIQKEIQRQLCGTAMLPFGIVLAGVLFSRRRKPLD